MAGTTVRVSLILRCRVMLYCRNHLQHAMPGSQNGAADYFTVGLSVTTTNSFSSGNSGCETVCFGQTLVSGRDVGKTCLSEVFLILSTGTKSHQKFCHRNALYPATGGIDYILKIIGHQYRFCCFMAFRRFLETGQLPIRYAGH